jgi:hypothetical protein
VNVSDPSHTRRVTPHDLLGIRNPWRRSVEERLDGLVVTARGGPHQSAAVVIDDDGQIALPLAMRYLVDADPPQPGEQIDLALRLIGDTLADAADRAPRDTHQLRNRGLGAVHGQPGRLVLERPREPRAMTRPGTAQTTTPWRRHVTRGACASTYAIVLSRSSARHRRRPSPRSNPGLRRQQIPQRSPSRQLGRAATTISPSSPICTSSTTARAKPNGRAHTRVPRTSHPLPSVPVLKKPEP